MGGLKARRPSLRRGGALNCALNGPCPHLRGCFPGPGRRARFKATPEGPTPTRPSSESPIIRVARHPSRPSSESPVGGGGRQPGVRRPCGRVGGCWTQCRVGGWQSGCWRGEGLGSPRCVPRCVCEVVCAGLCTYIGVGGVCGGKLTGKVGGRSDCGERQSERASEQEAQIPQERRERK